MGALRRLLSVSLLFLLGAGRRHAGAEPEPKTPSPKASRKVASLSYRVWVSSDLEAFVVSLCFDGEAPGALVPGEARARPHLSRALWIDEGGEEELSLDELGLRLPRGASEGCVRYRIDAGRAARVFGRPELAARFGRDLVVAGDLWLYRPPGPLPEGGEVVFELAPGVRISAPYEPLPSDGKGARYRLPKSAFRYYSYVALGDLLEEKVQVGGAEISLAALDQGAFSTPRAALLRWVRSSAEAVATLWGRFPTSRAQVLLLPVPMRGEDPVLFGMAVRGGGAGVFVLVHPEAREEELVGEWVLVHELSHHAVPFVQRRDAWLSEGLATYYQNVLRARAGLLDEREAWQEMTDGFARGAAAPAGTYVHTYWTGAAFSLLADVRLREQGRSLDEALESLLGCCQESGRAFTGRGLLEALDAALGGETLVRLYEKLPADRGLSRAPALLEALGVSTGEGGVVLEESAPLAHLRSAIVAPRGPSAKAGDPPPHR